MQRKYLEALRELNKDPYRKPMIVWGARQVGKTYLVRTFSRSRNTRDGISTSIAASTTVSSTIAGSMSTTRKS